MIYADIIGMLKPGYLDMLDTVSQELSPGMVLTFSLLLEVSIIMILLSRILDRKLNRLANFIAIPISILFVVYGGLTGPPISYLFFGGIENRYAGNRLASLELACGKRVIEAAALKSSSALRLRSA